MVQTWGQARAERAAGSVPGVAIRTSWAEVNARFGVSTYTDLPAARYAEVVQFVSLMVSYVDAHSTEKGTRVKGTL